MNIKEKVEQELFKMGIADEIRNLHGVINITERITKQEILAKLEELITTLRLELRRLASNECHTSDKAIENRIKIEQIHVEIIHLKKLKEKIGGDG